MSGGVRRDVVAWFSQADRVKLDGIAASAAALTSAAPAEIAEAADAGNGTTAARSNHVHALPIGDGLAWTGGELVPQVGTGLGISAVLGIFVDAATSGGAGSESKIPQLNGSGVLDITLLAHSTAASPQTSDNTAAGYADGSLWFDTQSKALWFKASEFGGSASWVYAGQSAQRATLADNTGTPTDVHSSLSFPYASVSAIQLKYTLTRGNSNRETGLMLIVIDAGTPASSSLDMTNKVTIGALGVTLTLAVSGSNVVVQYATTSTGTAATMYWEVAARH